MPLLDVFVEVAHLPSFVRTVVAGVGPLPSVDHVVVTELGPVYKGHLANGTRVRILDGHGLKPQLIEG